MNKNIKAGYESIRPYFLKFFLVLPLIIYAVYLITGIISHTITDSGIPNEYRESANVLMTMELLKGNNPYSLSALEGSLPPMIYLYGPLYSIVTALPGTLLNMAGTGYDIVSLHYFVTLICIIISAALGLIMVRERTGSLPLSLCAFLFLINCSWRYNYVNAVPDSMGLMIMMLILFLLTRREMKGMEALGAVLTVSVFFTKQYYLLIAGTAVIFLFIFRGMKSVAKYCLFLGAVSLAVIVFLYRECPLFWTYMLYLAKGPGTGVASTVTRGSVKMSGTEYNIQQIMSLGGIFLMFFVTEAAGCIYFFRRFIRGLSGRRIMSALENAGIDEFDCLMLIHMGVAGICLTYLGRNDGAWLSYYLELFMPALIMGALCLFHKVYRMAAESCTSAGRTGILKAIFLIYFIIFIGFTMYKSVIRLPVSPLSADDYREWRIAEETLDRHPGDMYLYPLLAYYGIHNDIYIYNTGQPFVVSERFYKSYHKHPDKMERYPYAEDIFTAHFDYRKEILKKVRNGEYSAVSYIEGTDEVFSREDLALNYRREQSLKLRTGRQVWDTEIWVRK